MPPKRSKSSKSSPKPRPAAPEPAAEPQEEPTKGMTLRLNLAAWKQLKQLALDQGRTAHALLIDALNDYFKKCRKRPVA